MIRLLFFLVLFPATSTPSFLYVYIIQLYTVPSGSRMQSFYSVKILSFFFGTACFNIIAVINIIVFLGFCSVLLDLRDDLALSLDANGIMRIFSCHVRWLCNVNGMKRSASFSRFTFRLVIDWWLFPWRFKDFPITNWTANGLWSFLFTVCRGNGFKGMSFCFTILI